MAEITHACPIPGTGITPCCSRPAYESPIDDRITAGPAGITCTGPRRPPMPRSELLRQLGRRIRLYRERAEISQQDLAARVYISRVQIGRYESGTREPGVTQVLAIAAALNVRPGTLLELLELDAYEDHRT